MAATLGVAIVTARDNKHTSYDRWHELRSALLERRGPVWGPERCEVPELLGEFGALLTACLHTPSERTHVEYQFRALALQTRQPDEVFVISRYDWSVPANYAPPKVCWYSPMLSDAEAIAYPLSRLGTVMDVNRVVPTSFGCADKNTALALNRCDYLLMLDDCCLPGPGTVAAAYETCAAGNVLLLGHQKLSFAGPDSYLPLRVSTSNWDPEAFAQERNVFGIFAAPMELILGVNGWNQTLDGQVIDLDVELKFRMDAYLRMKERRYIVSRAARVYEIDHETPWAREGVSLPTWRPTEGAAYPVRAPGVDLRELRELTRRELIRLETEERDDDEEDEEEFED